MEWAIRQGIETATFHILTPYPGTALHRRIWPEGRITSEDWDLYDTRHAVFRPAKMAAETLEEGYWAAYRDFYRWSGIFQAAMSQEGVVQKLRHLAYTAGWKKAEPLWDWIIRKGWLPKLLPVLEGVLNGLSGADIAVQATELPDAKSSLSLDAE